MRIGTSGSQCTSPTVHKHTPLHVDAHKDPLVFLKETSIGKNKKLKRQPHLFVYFFITIIVSLLDPARPFKNHIVFMIIK